MIYLIPDWWSKLMESIRRLKLCHVLVANLRAVAAPDSRAHVKPQFGQLIGEASPPLN